MAAFARGRPFAHHADSARRTPQTHLFVQTNAHHAHIAVTARPPADHRDVPRHERKARAVMDKIAGLKRVDGEFKEVQMVRQGTVFVIEDPVVYKCPQTNCYVVFGPYGVPDYMELAKQQLSQWQNSEAGAAGTSGTGAEVDASLPGTGVKDAVDEVDDDAEVDETGVEPKDIELVMTQAGVSRSKAVTALKAADGDIVTAIMELTM